MIQSNMDAFLAVLCLQTVLLVYQRYLGFHFLLTVRLLLLIALPRVEDAFLNSLNCSLIHFGVLRYIKAQG